MSYLFKSFATLSFWKYALFSKEGLATLFACVGLLYAFIEMMDFFGLYTKDNYSKYSIIPIFIVSIIYVIFTRRPISKFVYKIPKKDYALEVKICDLFSEAGDIVISSSTTFDTDLSNGLISPESLQGQFALQVFNGNTAEIDTQLDAALQDIAFSERSNAPGKTREYPIGTVAKVKSHGKTFYFVAMSRLNDHGTAKSTVRDIEDALTGLWEFASNQGELRNIVIPLMGTGRGRIEMSRKKMAERIAQSFADASADAIFSNKLVIVVRPKDAEKFGVNLFEVRDYFTQSLNV